MHLLLLPGMDGTGRLFEPLVRVLPPWLSSTVVAYPPDQPLGYSELLPLVEKAAPRDVDFVVLGESFSGPLALMLAAGQPAGLRGVVLCASFVRSPLPWLTCLRPFVHPLWFRMAPLSLTRRLLLGQYQTPELCRILTSTLASVAPHVMAARARAILSVNVTSQLRKCAAPILYLQAKQDRVVPPSSLTLIQHVQPRTENASLPGPHLLLQANPRAAAVAIADFISRLAVSPASGWVAPSP